MAVKRVYLDWVDDNEFCFIPADFPDFTNISGGDFYDYYKVNRWFERNKRLLLCRWGHCCDCDNFTPEIKEQQCQYPDDGSWDIETCHSLSETKIGENE